MMLLLVIASITLSSIGHLARADSNAPEVTINNWGTIRGEYHKVPSTGETVSVFKGIPYAEPPVGKRRFMASRILCPFFRNNCL
jgi:hypothetical protein